MSVTEPLDQRQRILDAALHLMAERGVHAMSMRTLADRVRAQRGHALSLLPEQGRSPGRGRAPTGLRRACSRRSRRSMPASPPQARLAALLRWIWEQMAGQDDMWRLLLGESLRGDAAVMGSAAELSAMFEAALDRWILELFGDRADRASARPRTTWTHLRLLHRVLAVALRGPDALPRPTGR